MNYFLRFLLSLELSDRLLRAGLFINHLTFNLNLSPIKCLLTTWQIVCVQTNSPVRLLNMVALLLPKCEHLDYAALSLTYDLLLYCSLDGCYSLRLGIGFL